MNKVKNLSEYPQRYLLGGDTEKKILVLPTPRHDHEPEIQQDRGIRFSYLL